MLIFLYLEYAFIYQLNFLKFCIYSCYAALVNSYVLLFIYWCNISSLCLFVRARMRLIFLIVLMHALIFSVAC